MLDRKLYLFKVKRRGYDPEEVLVCFQKMIRIFSDRITRYDQLVKQWGEEAHLLKIQAGRDRKWIEELTKENQRLLEENRRLRNAKPAWRGQTGADVGESGSPCPPTPSS